jgi:hypothetical protein
MWARFDSLVRSPLEQEVRLTVDEWRTTATATMLPPVKFDNNRLFLGYVKNPSSIPNPPI